VRSEKEREKTSPAAASPAQSGLLSERRRTRLVQRTRLYAALYLLMLPTIVGMALFSYYPKISVVKYSLYKWDGSMTEEYIGWKNFIEAFTGDPLFWHTFKLVGILLAANLLKMWPCIFAAIVLHRLKSERWQYIYRVLFVVPMVIPALVWLLIWKSFYDPNVGILNHFLRRTHLMGALQWLDGAAPGLAAALTPVRAWSADAFFGSAWGMAVVGAIVLTMVGGLRSVRIRWIWWVMLLAAAALLFNPKIVVAAVSGIPLVSEIPGAGRLLAWACWALALAAIIAVCQYLRRHETGRTALMWAGGALIGAAAFFILTTMIWSKPTNAFITGSPAWLGHSKLIIPAMIFWGFPWVGTVGVLIYLAGLQNISQDVYEAAELDGCGPFTKLFRIELPLILTQVRINLIFLTIGTLSSYGRFLLLLGPDGGPDNKGMVPGLYMYKTAFIDGRFGYACALGMVMFVVILTLTVIYQKYVRVEK